MNAEQEYEKYGKNFLCLKKDFSLIILLMFFLGFLLIPLFGVYSPIVVITLKNIIRHYEYKIEYEYENTKENCEKLIRDINNTTTSCDNFIYNKIELYQNSLKNDELKTSEIMANELITNYIDNGIIIDVPESVWKYAIDILQFELQSNEKDLSILLESARSKISEDNLNSELIKSRNIENK